jgi:hypothetical protein
LTFLDLLAPSYYNDELEQIITKAKDHSELDLSENGLNCKDMETVPFYALQQNTVSNIVLLVSIENNRTALFYFGLRGQYRFIEYFE